MKGTLEILTQYLKVKHFSQKNRTKLEIWQEERIVKHLKKVSKNSPYIRNLIEIYGVKNWRDFPLMNKSVMMDNFNSLNTLGLTKEDCFEIAFKAEETRNFSPTINGVTVGLSSGTSGNRGIFLVSEKEQNQWTGAVLAKLLPSHLLSKEEERIAFFLRSNSNLYESVNKGSISFKFFDLLDTLDNHIAGLKELNPSIIVAPPSMLRFITERVEQNELQLNVKKIISVAEVLDPIDKKYIESILKKPIHQVYQCTEGFLGATCEYGTLHLNEDIVHIEKKYIDEELGKFIPIITDFSRTSQPIIRYELNDILTESKKECPCGSPNIAIEQIEGRCDDIFSFKSKNTNCTIFPDFIRRAIIKSSNSIKEYQVQQLSFNEITVRLKVEEGSNIKEIEEAINKELNILFLHYAIEEDITINFKYNIEYTAGRKLKRIERKF